MNDELTTQTPSPPIVLKLKKYDDIILPHTSRLSTDTLNDNSPATSFIPINENPIITTVTSSPLRVKLKKSFINGDDDEYTNTNSSEIISRPAKRSKKSSSNDNLSNTISQLNNDQISSQSEMNQLKQEHCTITEQSPSSPLILKIRRNSLTSTIGNSTTVETDTNRQILLKFKQNEYGELTASTTPNDNSLNLINNNNNANNEYTNGHNNNNNSIQQDNQNSNQPHITNMLSNLNDDKQWNNHQMNSNHISQQTPTTSHVSMDVTITPTSSSTLSTTAESHTKELLDEALDSVKNVLMQTFKKNLESGGDLKYINLF